MDDAIGVVADALWSPAQAGDLCTLQRGDRAPRGAYGTGVPAPAPGRSANGVIALRVGSGCQGRNPAEPASDNPQAARISRGTSTITAMTTARRRRRSTS